MENVFLVFVVLLVIACGGFYVLGRQSQQGSAPGLIDGQLAPCPASPNCVSSETGTVETKKVAPLSVDAWSQLPQVLVEMGGVITAQEETYLACEFSSRTFKFVDDVEFRRDADTVHVRSASRVGYSDRGVNRARVDDLCARLS